MSHCNCGGNCASCGGCAKTLTITPEELEFLRLFGQIPFLPVIRKREDMVPVYPEEPEKIAENSLVLQCLEKKGLISVDYAKSLGDCQGELYRQYPVHGSMGLTERGYTVLEMAEIQGFFEE